jgi:hypothetical protein
MNPRLRSEKAASDKFSYGIVQCSMFMAMAWPYLSITRKLIIILLISVY